MLCVQTALAMVKDGIDEGRRETERINIVMRALKHAQTLDQGTR